MYGIIIGIATRAVNSLLFSPGPRPLLALRSINEGWVAGVLTLLFPRLLASGPVAQTQ